MTPSLDPIAAGTGITETYTRYLGSLLQLSDSDLVDRIDEQLRRPGAITRGPLLEITPPFTTAASLRDLINQDVLHPGVERFFSPALPGDRPLYSHQERAIRKAVGGRNLIIATGTGSGKTESFLVPILNHLAAERSTGSLGPGVRALVLYPMNALANDQLKRLRQVLAPTPEVTFGRYVGETMDDPQAARTRYLAQHGTEPLPNEILSRQEMQQSPPHLLLTNYAMLEYLLLRPRDIPLFEGEASGRWRFVVVDEAHVYDGVKGAEIAMLLRRLRERVARGKALQCLASSATVGDDFAKVASFGRGLFGLPFDFDQDVEARRDVVGAERHPVPVGSTWGPLSAEQLGELHAAEDPSGWLNVYDAGSLEDEQSMRTLQRRLSKGPQDLRDLARSLFPDVPTQEAEKAVVDLVAVGHRVLGRSGSAVLSARYHMFASGVDGAFACLSPEGPHVRFSRHEQCPECAAAMFEIAACKRCGQLHLPGHVIVDRGRERMGPGTPYGGMHWLAVGDHVIASDEDDDPHMQGTRQDSDSLAATLCTHCATLAGPDATTCPECGTTAVRRVLRMDAGHELNSCRACGGRSPRQVRRFSTGADATAAVLATALYEHIPTDPAVLFPGGGRRLLMFSDSRQQAAFAAPYLQNSYGSLLHRTLIARALERENGEILSTADVAVATRREAQRSDLFDDDTTAFARRTEVATWIQREMIEGDERNSLEGTALVAVRMRRPPDPPPQPLLRLGLNPDQAWTVLDQLTQTLRTQGAVAPLDDNVDLTSDYLAPRNRAVYVRGLQSDSTQNVLSWVPSSRSYSNRRLDYLTRILRALGSNEDPWQLLTNIWTYVSNAEYGPGWLTAINDPRRGPVWRVDPAALRWSWQAVTDTIWRCTTCRRPAAQEVRGVCPTNGCSGNLRNEVVTRDPRDHYATTYLTMASHPLRAEEHTAQIAAQTASMLQDQFINGRVNVLSCSTTFELGVDVGELQTVLLRNVPPSTANYVQRAGRAGRRTDSAALVVTYAQMRSHDQAMYQRPEAMIQGTVRAPVVVDDNARVDRRHAHSVALAAFFRATYEEAGREFRTVSDFYGGDTDTGQELLASFLDPPPVPVLEALAEVLPATVHEEIGLPDNSWVKTLLELVDLAGTEYRQDVGYFHERIAAEVSNKKYRTADVLQNVVRTLDRQQLFGYFSRRNILPKYGFPVDTVELRVSPDVDPAATTLDLSRDLAVAINEYAPGAAIVARGKIVTSAGVYRYPQRELVRRQYAVCPACERLEVSVGELDSTCVCGTPRQGGRRSFVKPEFGFVADRQMPKVWMSRPRSMWFSRQFLLDEGHPSAEDTAMTGIGRVSWRLSLRGRMCVVNEGPGQGRFMICDWCGFGAPAAGPPGRRGAGHKRPLTGRPCNGQMSSLALAHDYETDILILDFQSVQDQSQARSLTYGLLAGAADALEIARDDLDGTLISSQDNAVVLFDTVPGGAGLVRRIATDLPKVVDAMCQRIKSCDCGAETSCHRCLRVYRNQHFHDQLRRDHVLELIRN